MKTKIIAVLVCILLIVTCFPTLGKIVNDNPLQIQDKIGESIESIPIIKFKNIVGDILSISVVLKNLGNGTAFDIYWEMNISGGLFYYPRIKNGTIDNPLDPGEETKIYIKPVIGLGRCEVFFYCKYKMIFDSSKEELEVEVKQEGQNKGNLLRNEFEIEEQSNKEWLEIENFEYIEEDSVKFVKLKPEYNITNMHNVRVIDNATQNLLYRGACCFENDLATLNEGWITKDYIENGFAYWEVELIGSEAIEQEQPEVSFKASNFNYPNHIIAQGFVPWNNILPRVSLFISRVGDIVDDIKVSIRSNLDGTDLTSISIPYYKTARNRRYWIGFDFEDINVTPGETYYIVYNTSWVDDYNSYELWSSDENSYLNGKSWIQRSNGEWIEISGDSCFRTYFMDNPFKAPNITGPSSGEIGEELEFTFVATCPEEGDIYYFVDWGHYGPFFYPSWIGPYASGEEITLKHSWNRQYNYALRIKAKNIEGAESDWGYLEVNIKRGNPLYDFLLQILEIFPNAFPILRILFGLENLY